MAIVFDAVTRKSVSGRLVGIPIENANYDAAIANMNLAAATFGNIDSGNKLFFDHYLNLATLYESEITSKSGDVIGTYSETDLENGARQAPGNLFFPTTDPFNLFYIPKIIPEVNGAVVGLGSLFEYQDFGSYTLGVLGSDPADNSPSGNGIPQIITLLQSGFSYAGGPSTLASAFTFGDSVIDVVSTAGFNPGEYILVTGGGSSGIFVLKSIGVGVLNVFQICCPAGGFSVGATVTRSFPGFPEGDRTAGIAGTPTYQDILDQLETVGSNSLVAAANDWNTLLNNQLGYLASNDDPRATQSAQNLAEASAIAPYVAFIASWAATLPAGDRFNNANLATFAAPIASRIAALPARLAEIPPALGGVVDNGDGTYAPLAGDDTAIYYDRYFWTDVRINRVFGSLMKTIKSTQGSGIINYVKAENLLILDQYDDVLSAAKFAKSGDDTVYVELTSVTGFSIADNVYAVSDDQSEIAVTIQNISGNVLTLNLAIPKAFTIFKNARILKVL